MRCKVNRNRKMEMEKKICIEAKIILNDVKNRNEIGSRKTLKLKSR